MLSVAYGDCRNLFTYVEWYYAQCRYIECLGAI
jgi:hypothetical protein